MFQLRKETDYALQFLKLLAKQPNSLLSLRAAAARTRLSFLFLQKIARKLRRAGLIKAACGVKGGYRLRAPLSQLNLRRIIEVMEGKCGLLFCSDEGKRRACVLRDNCLLRAKMDKVNRQILKILAKVKLKDI